MLSPKTLAGFNAKARRVPAVSRTIVQARSQLIALIDDFWRYYCNPADYSYLDRQVDPSSGQVVDVFVAARWKSEHYIVENRDGHTIIALFWEGQYLPLTRRGDQEIVMPAATISDVEQILAEIKHSVKTGAMDSYLGDKPLLPAS